MVKHIKLLDLMGILKFTIDTDSLILKIIALGCLFISHCTMLFYNLAYVDYEFHCHQFKQLLYIIIQLKCRIFLFTPLIR